MEALSVYILNAHRVSDDDTANTCLVSERRYDESTRNKITTAFQSNAQSLVPY